MAGSDGGNSRIADLMQGNPLTFGGFGIASWQPGGAEAAQPAGFPVFMDDDLPQPPPVAGRARAAKLHRPPAAPLAVNDENRPPPEARLRVKTYSQAAADRRAGLSDKENQAPGRPPLGAATAAASCGFQVYTDPENVAPAPRRAKTYGQMAAESGAAASCGFQVYTDQENDAPAPRRGKTYGQAASASVLQPAGEAGSCGFQVYTDPENAAPPAPRRAKTYGQAAALQPAATESGAPGRPPLAARQDEQRRPARAQQRKQKLKQRPQEQLQSTKRAALQPLPPAPDPARLPSLFDWDRGPPPEDDVHDALLRPAPSVTVPSALCEAPMASPESLHSSLDSITISPRRGRLDALFSYEEYAADLYLIMRQVELEHRPREDFMSRQTDITVTMRSILVDWLVEVNEEYKLHSETLHLAVNYIDRFLSVMTVVRAKLQLVGTTALFIASKFEEIYPPTVKEFVYITDDTYTDQQLKRMEHVMLKMLAFDMSAPTSNWFLNYFMDNGGAGEDTVRYLAQYLVELTLVQYTICNRHVSSVQAAAALCVARFCCGHEPWTSALERLSGLGREQLRSCVTELMTVYQSARDLPQQAIVDKFAKDKFLAVSQLEPPPAFVWD